MDTIQAIVKEAERLKEEASTYIEPELMDLIVRMTKKLGELERKNQALSQRINGLDNRTSRLIRF